MPRRELTKGEKGALGVLGAVLAFLGIRHLLQAHEGDTKCVGFDLYEYQQGGWALIEANSTACGWEPGEAEFQVSDLVIEPTTVNVAEPVDIGVIVTNIGGKRGTKTVRMEVI